MLKVILIVLGTLALGACSLYTSPGRKCLEEGQSCIRITIQSVSPSIKKSCFWSEPPQSLPAVLQWTVAPAKTQGMELLVGELHYETALSQSSSSSAASCTFAFASDQALQMQSPALMANVRSYLRQSGFRISQKSAK